MDINKTIVLLRLIRLWLKGQHTLGGENGGVPEVAHRQTRYASDGGRQRHTGVGPSRVFMGTRRVVSGIGVCALGGTLFGRPAVTALKTNLRFILTYPTT